MAKKLRSKYESQDWVRAVVSGSWKNVEINVNIGTDENYIFLTPSDAKKLRKQIKAALAEIEDEPEEDIPSEKEEPAYIPYVGDVVEVVENTSAHHFKIGQKVRASDIYDGYCLFSSLDTSAEWCATNTDIRPIQNWKPKEGEKVLIVGSSFAPNKTTRSWVGNFGIIGPNAWDVALVYNEDKSDWFGFHASDLRPAE